MTYGDLIPYNVAMKLNMVSFRTPQKNLAVYRFVNAMKEAQKFVDIERSKLFEKYGEKEDDSTTVIKPENIEIFKKELYDILDMEIEETIPSPKLKESDFEDSNCSYPEDKSLWMNGAELEAVLLLSNKLENDKKGC